ncbi:lipoprotein-releasing system ATP-binding protein [Micromonospora pallida]|uniref:Lipoprotein-releasing system ATP-binding protein n=1 Tax=Micromonospora pallida TaxID=145854 RepID=A0A1C6TBI7_9ACTN|nr:ABC transporter ATP-binding protein [Micromonospora pallida]SCL38845.1 lipoprotein-releasing system ATP-binding protein [Micromonospora pallida]
MSSILTARGLRLAMGNQTVLDEVDLTVQAGESVAVIGPSGSGKTTLLSCLAGLVEPDSGEVSVAGQPVTSVPKKRRAEIRLSAVGFVYQFGELLPELTVLENVLLPALLAGRPRASARDRATTLLDRLDLAGLADRSAAVLSGGERQRTAVARALINEPALLLADEPTGALDPAYVDSVADLLFSLPVDFGCALVLVTHNTAVARRAKRCLSLSDGTLTEVAC